MADALMLSRIQFGITAGYHILWPLLSIGLSLYLVVLEAAYLRTKNTLYYHQLRFWSKLFVLSFAMGVATGVPLEFQFGTNWATFSKSAGDFFGNTLGFEATVAFMLEASFLAVFIFGWKRVKPAMHFFANCMVFVGATLSAFWIMAANSWMQTPTGVVMQDGIITVADYHAAVWNPLTVVSFVHMWIACIQATMFLIIGVAAWRLLQLTRRQDTRFWLATLKFALAVAVVFAAVQMVSGDASARAVTRLQPAKAAAMEAHWTTNAPGHSADWNVIAFPDEDDENNSFAIAIPGALSWLSYRNADEQVKGLDQFAKSDRPPVAGPFWAFRVMVGAGVLMLIVASWGVIAWLMGSLEPDVLRAQRPLLKALLWSAPLGLVATEAGWFVREVGRQPWIVYNLIRTGEGITPNLSAGFVQVTLIGFCLFYLISFVCFLYFARKIIRAGPNLTEQPPALRRRKK